MMPPTTHGHGAFEALSVIQKAIRRNDEELAMLWALELCDTSKAYFTMTVNRLKVIAHEDIGLADPQAVMFAVQTCNAMEGTYERKGWRLLLTNAIRVLARASKSREADHFLWLIRHQHLTEGPGKVPDYALDHHTAKGKRMGRGVEFFLAESTKITPDAGQDIYRERAHALRRRVGFPSKDAKPNKSKPSGNRRTQSDDDDHGSLF